jgi:hypothetical protein
MHETKTAGETGRTELTLISGLAAVSVIKPIKTVTKTFK